MRLLLDTQVLIWLMTDRDWLNRRERQAIDAGNELVVSTLSLIELRIKRRTERRRGLSATVPSPEHAIVFCAARDIVIHPLLAEHTTLTLANDPPHGDPFDEMILAHAQGLQAKLLTRDKHLRDHPLAYQP